MNFKVRAFIFQCRDLPAADSDGTSDPYICVWDTGKKTQQTKYIEDNVNPLFYETIELVYEANKIDELPPFIFDVYDKDFNPLDEDDFICRAIIPVSEAAVVYEKDEVPRPKWHKCRLKQNSPECGEVLVSFAIVSDDFNFKTPVKYMNLMETVLFDEYTIEISILGLRDLQSVGILPVKKAFITFNLKSLIPPDCAQAIENIKTQPGPAGPNPTINTIIKFTLPLPGDALYCPKLQCSVYDNIFKSFMQPLLGVFTIPIGEILHQKQSKRQEEMTNLDQIIQELEKIMQDRGVTTYNIQGSVIEEDMSFRQTIKIQKEKIEKELTAGKSKEEKKEIREGIARPLLLNLDSDEHNDEYGLPTSSALVEEQKTPTRTPRKTPRDLTPQSDQKKKGLGLITSGLSFFNKREDKGKLLQEQKEKDEKKKRDEQSLREKEMEELKRTGANPYKNIMKPQYRMDDTLKVMREITKPPDSLYIGLGWDESPEESKRHYRRYCADELENNKELMGEPPFIQYLLKKGQTRGASKGWWPFNGQKEDESGSINTEQIMGKFKCLIDIESEREKKEHA